MPMMDWCKWLIGENDWFMQMIDWRKWLIDANDWYRQMADKLIVQMINWLSTWLIDANDWLLCIQVWWVTAGRGQSPEDPEGFTWQEKCSQAQG